MLNQEVWHSPIISSLVDTTGLPWNRRDGGAINLFVESFPHLGLSDARVILRKLAKWHAYRCLALQSQIVLRVFKGHPGPHTSTIYILVKLAIEVLSIHASMQAIATRGADQTRLDSGGPTKHLGDIAFDMPWAHYRYILGAMVYKLSLLLQPLQSLCDAFLSVFQLFDVL